MGDATRPESKPRRSRQTTADRSRLVKNYLACSRCSEARHKNSSSGLCQKCYWIERREGSPLTGLTKAEYDATRYDPRRRRDAYLRKQFGISLDDYEAMADRQDGRCAVCGLTPESPRAGKRFTNGVLVVDHCHATGRVRGLLCDPCNRGLGQFGDNIDMLWSAISYLSATAQLDPSRRR